MDTYSIEQVNELTGLNKIIFDEREDVVKNLRNPKTKEFYSNNEESIRQGYRGREFLELLQNTEDAFFDNGGETKITLRDDTLEIVNTGKPFDAEGTKSIVWPHASSKVGTGLMGEKGIGLRSLLNIADTISIFSDTLSIRLSRKDANEFYAKHGFNDEKLPIFMAPKIIKPEKVKKYATRIFIKLKDNEIASTKTKLDNIVSESVVFLRKFSKLTIINDDDVRIITKTATNERRYILREEYNGNITKETEYEIISKTFKNVFSGIDSDGNEEHNDAKIILAYSSKNNPVNPLYCYFPTEMKVNLPWLIHANFKIKDTRDALQPDNPFNKKVLEYIVDTLFEELESQTTYENNSYGVAKKLINDMRNLSILDYIDHGDNWKFDDVFCRRLKKARIWPVINGKYLSFADNLVHYSSEISNFVSQEEFDNMTSYSSTEDVDQLIEYYCKWLGITMKYSNSEFVKRLNRQHITDPDVLAKTIEALCVERRNNYELNFRDAKIFLDQTGKLKTGQQIIFEDSNRKVSLPSFISFKYPDKHLYEILSACPISMDSLYNTFGILKTENLGNIIDVCIQKVGDNFQRSLEFLRWIFLSGTNISGKILPIPTRAKTIGSSNGVYLSNDYCQSFCEKLWKDDEKFICDFTEFKIAISKKNDFVKFLRMIGLSDVPYRISNNFMPIQRTQIGNYEEYATEHMEFPCKCPRGACRETFKNLDEIKEHGYLTVSNRFDEPSFDDFEHILDHTPHSTLFSLFAKTDFGYLFDNNSHICLRCNRGLSGLQPIDTTQSPSYAAFLIKFTPWIKIRGKKYAPAQVVLNDNLGDQFLPHVVGISKEKLFPKELLENSAVLDGLITNIGINKDFETLDKNLVYQIASELPEKDPSGKFAKRFYDAMIRRDENIVPTGNAHDDFVKNGKIFCKDNQYHPTSDSYYSSLKVPKAATRGKNLAYLPSKQGIKKLQKLFGIKEISTNYFATNIVPINDKDHAKFEREIDSIKIATLSDVNTSIKKPGPKSKNSSYRGLLKLRIIPCQGFDIETGNGIEKADFLDYAKSKDSNDIYLNIENYHEYADLLRECEVEFRDIMVEIFETATNLNDNPIIKKYIDLSKYESRKEKIIRQYSGDDSEWWKNAEIVIGKDKIKEENVFDQNRKKLSDLFSVETENYKIKLYESLKSASMEEQMQYNHKIEQFQMSKLSDEDLLPLHDEDFDAKAFLEKLYPELRIQNVENNLGQNNLDKLKEYIKKEYPELIELFENKVIAEYGKLNALAIFGHDNEVIEKLNKIKVQEVLNPPEPSKPKPLTEIAGDVHPVDTEQKPAQKRSRFSTGNNKQKEENQRKKGEQAELRAFEALQSLHPDVRGVSSNLRKLGKISADGNVDDSAGYDLCYVEDGVTHCVEVKSSNLDSHNAFSFELSMNEYLRASEIMNETAGGRTYEVFVVFDENDQYKILDFEEIERCKNISGYKVTAEL